MQRYHQDCACQGVFVQVVAKILGSQHKSSTVQSLTDSSSCLITIFPLPSSSAWLAWSTGFWKEGLSQVITEEQTLSLKVLLWILGDIAAERGKEKSTGLG